MNTIPSSLVPVDDPWEGSYAVGLLAFRFFVPKLLVTMKKSCQLSLCNIVSLKRIGKNRKNLLYMKFCVHCLEKKQSLLEEKKNKPWFPSSSAMQELRLWASHLTSVSQNLICKMMIMKSALVESIIMSSPSVREMLLPCISHEVLAGGFDSDTPHLGLGRHLPSTCLITMAYPPELT